jgi:hypothetical protein
VPGSLAAKRTPLFRNESCRSYAPPGLSSVSQFVIPICQPTYSWTQKECQQFWDEIVRAGSTDEIGVHFISSVVYLEEGQATIAVKPLKLVIDGQQRDTTVTLLLLALAEMLSGLPDEHEGPFDGFSPAKIRQYYLTNPLDRKEKRFKLLLLDTDRATLIAVVDPSVVAAPQEPSIRILQKHAFFLEQLRHPPMILPWSAVASASCWWWMWSLPAIWTIRS